MSKKRVIVISEYFAPQSSIASVRFTKILKYLSRKGEYIFYVIARKSNGQNDAILCKDLDEMKENVIVYYVDVMDNWIDSLRRKKNSNLSIDNNGDSSLNAIKFKAYKDSTIKEKIYKCINTMKYIYNEKLFVNRGLQIVENIGEEIDCVISTYGDAGAHILGNKIKNKYKNIKWIADYRDPANTYYRPLIFSNYFKNIDKLCKKNADVITGVNKVSMGICADLSKSKVIINGFDKEDCRCINDDINLIKSNKFHICYTGRIYEGKSDAGKLFKVLNELSEKRLININDIQIEYAGTNGDLLRQQAKKENLEKIIFDHGFLQRKEVLSIQRNSELLLVLSWNDDDEEDVLTGKFMEYLMSNKNILAIVNGNKYDSTIFRIVNECGVGFCYEEARGSKQYVELCNYLLKSYAEWKKTGDVKYEVNSLELNKYSYSNISNMFDEIINN